MMVHMHVTLGMFCIFSFCSIWFLLFSEGPTSWFQNHYYIKDQGDLHATTKQPHKDTEVYNHLSEAGISFLVQALGVFCGFVSFILYVSI
jgi:hypothetical protein